MFRMIRFGVRTLLVIAILEYMFPDMFIKSAEVTAKMIGTGIGDGLWSLFSSIGGHILHHEGK